MIYTLDANIFVADIIVTDVHHPASQTFLDALRLRNETVYCPTLILTEAVAAIARPTGDTRLALSDIDIIRGFPNMNLISLTSTRAKEAAILAADFRLRGADTVYLAVATEFGASLITWDTEMRTRGAGIITTMTPSEWLSAPLP